MNIQMLDLSEQYGKIKDEVNKAIEEVLTSTRFILGPNVKSLEESIASYSKTKYGIGVASGSDALVLSLLGCGIQPGDEVIVPAFTFFATAGAVSRIGAKPVFVDIDEKTFNIDPVKIEEAISDKTKAIIPVHLYGQMAKMEKIMNIAKKHNLVVIEDAAQAIGSKYKKVGPGEWGKTACYSFFPTKNLGAYGDAGMVITNDEDIAEKIRVLRVHGSKPKYHHHVLGYNSRLDELHAAILNVKLKYLDEWNNNRRKNAYYYNQLINNEPFLTEFVQTPFEDEQIFHTYHQYTLRVQHRDGLQAFLKEQGISTMVYYPLPLHLQPVFNYLGYKEGDLPVTEKACNEVLSLPMYPELKHEQQEYIIEKIKEFYSK